MNCYSWLNKNKEENRHHLCNTGRNYIKRIAPTWYSGEYKTCFFTTAIILLCLSKLILSMVRHAQKLFANRRNHHLTGGQNLDLLQKLRSKLGPRGWLQLRKNDLRPLGDCGDRLGKQPPVVEGPGGRRLEGIRKSCSIATGNAGQQKVFHAGGLVAEAATGAHLLQIVARPVVRRPGDAGVAPPGFPWLRLGLRFSRGVKDEKCVLARLLGQVAQRIHLHSGLILRKSSNDATQITLGLDADRILDATHVEPPPDVGHHQVPH